MDTTRSISTKTGKDISDFLLAEYDKIADAHFNAQEILSRWVRFYFLVVAAPLTLLVLFAGKGQIVDLQKPPGFFPVLTCLTGIVGVFISLVIFDIRLDAALYARAVNGIRKYFLDNHAMEEKDSVNPDEKLPENLYLATPSLYVVLPTDINKPSLKTLSFNAWIFVSMFILINLLYVCYWPFVEGQVWLCVIIALVFIAGHPVAHTLIGRDKEKKYVNPDSGVPE